VGFRLSGKQTRIGGDTRLNVRDDYKKGLSSGARLSQLVGLRTVEVSSEPPVGASGSDAGRGTGRKIVEGFLRSSYNEKERVLV